jgi:hypothetical protein
LIEPEKLKTEADWTEAGRRVFQEFDSELLRTFDPQFIALVRDPNRLDELATDPLPDGTLNGLRWVPTKLGVALTFPSCSGCHTAFQQDGSPTGLVSGALFARRLGREPGRDVQSGSRTRHACTGRLDSTGYEDPRDPRPRIRFESHAGRTRRTHCFLTDALIFIQGTAHDHTGQGAR